MIVAGIVIIAAMTVFMHGSLELYPTEEQQGKIQIVLALLICTSGFVEALLWIFYKRLRSK